jgi:ubiquinone/menaquinone biosynthesis C-methylase UbiE
MATAAQVRDYWEQQACGTQYADAPPLTPEYFDQVEKKRYELEPFIPRHAEFPTWTDKRVLEIGVGAGTDFVNFARAGANLCGVDLTQAGIEHCRRRLALEGLEADLRVASGEDLPFADEEFDLVWSWGVIHHAEHPEAVLREVRRVLKPGGQARIMMYGRHSWFAYKTWAKSAVTRLLAFTRPPSLWEAVAYDVESPGTHSYTRRELEIMVRAAGLERVTVTGEVTPYDRDHLGPLSWLPNVVRLDWFLVVRAVRIEN